jgi:CDP-diacylglycerol--glycerol-3-phosphate 3-phosphatidyltransferase
MTALSIISAVDYFIGFWRQIDRASDTTRQSSAVLTRRAKPAAKPALDPTTKQKA